MSKIDLGQTITLLANLGVIGGLIFVGFQLRQDRSIAVAQLNAEYDSTQIEMASLISGHSEVWTRGLSGEELDRAELAIFQSIAEAPFSKESSRHSRALLITGVAPQGIIERNANLVYAYPGLRRAWSASTGFYRGHEHSQWFGDYLDSIDAIIQDFESGTRDAPPHSTYAPM